LCSSRPTRNQTFNHKDTKDTKPTPGIPLRTPLCVFVPLWLTPVSVPQVKTDLDSCRLSNILTRSQA